MTIDVYISYAQQDTAWMERLRKQLSAAERIGLVDAWHDGEIEIGTDKVEAAQKAMEAAEIVVLLLSADFFASEYLYEQEMGRALELAKAKKVTLIPVLLRDCTWQLTPLAQHQILPKNGKPITDNSWSNPDRALKQVVDEVIRISTAMRSGEKAPVAYAPISEQVTTTEKTFTKTIRQEGKPKEAETSVWRLAIYAIAGLGAFALVSFILKKAFVNPPPVEPTAQVNTQASETTDNDNTSEVLTTAEENARGSAPFASVQLGNLEWSAENIAIPSSGATAFEDQDKTTEHGLLYTLSAARTICPNGWRLPKRNDWSSLSASDIKKLNLSKGGFFYKGWMQTGAIGYYLTPENTAGDQVWIAKYRGDDQLLQVDRFYAHYGMSCRCVR